MFLIEGLALYPTGYTGYLLYNSFGRMPIWAGLLLLDCVLADRLVIGLRHEGPATVAEWHGKVDRKGMVRVGVAQNGPYKTSPYGSEWYKVGTVLTLVATPNPDHPFRKWECNTELIEIANPFSPSTTAVLKGTGLITADFE